MKDLRQKNTEIQRSNSNLAAKNADLNKELDHQKDLYHIMKCEYEKKITDL